MQTSTPKSLLIMTILLILLTLISLATPVLSGLSAGRLPGMMLQVGKFPPENANPPSDGGFQGRQPQPGSENFLQRSDGNAFHPFQATRAPGLGGQAMIYINYGVGVIGAGLAGLAAFWVWRKKKSGLNLALVLAILFLLGALPGIFLGLRMMGAAAILRYALHLLSAGISLVILVMGIMPSVRDEVE